LPVTLRYTPDPRAVFKLAVKLSEDNQDLLEELAFYFADQIRLNFDLQGRGDPWPPRQVPNIAGILDDLNRGNPIRDSRFEDRPALVDTSALRNSIFGTVQGKQSIQIGANLDYADLMLKGGERTIPITPTARRNLFAVKDSDPRLEELGWIFNTHRPQSVTVDVQGRNFMEIMPEDFDNAVAIVEDHLNQ